ncbi:uncharacterized protein LOC108599346 [Drosophila busckii]|uniref:uncharacterized protein LOC108599346 n=1 Tax=Drosophila busckii TaxID=30019 RepID=UPI001432F65F|nr:uncharacterized protein LOC108599346 [Drosophila busckii]
MMVATGQLMLIMLIGLWTLYASADESRLNENGVRVYKFVDKKGMEWEYERVREQHTDAVNGTEEEEVVVYNGPWQKQSNSIATRSCQHAPHAAALILGSVLNILTN